MLDSPGISGGFSVAELGGSGRNLAPGRRTLLPGCPPPYRTPAFQQKPPSEREGLGSLDLTLLPTFTLFPFHPIFLFAAMTIFTTSVCTSRALLSLPTTWQTGKDLKAASYCARQQSQATPLPPCQPRSQNEFPIFMHLNTRAQRFPSPPPSASS